MRIALLIGNEADASQIGQLAGTTTSRCLIIRSKGLGFEL